MMFNWLFTVGRKRLNIQVWIMVCSYLKLNFDPLELRVTCSGNQPLFCRKQPREPTCYKSDLQESKLLSLETIQEAK